MKQVIAIVKPFLAEKVLEGLKRAPLEALVVRAERIRPNWPDIHEGHIGPFIFQEQGRKVQEQIDSAVAAGATVVVTGRSKSMPGAQEVVDSLKAAAGNAMAVEKIHHDLYAEAFAAVKAGGELLPPTAIAVAAVATVPCSSTLMRAS